MSLKTKKYSFYELDELERDQWPTLDLPGIVIDSCRIPKDGGKYMLFLTHVAKDLKLACECSVCKSKNIRRDGTGKFRLVHDVIRNNYRVDILIKPPRYRCTDCDASWSPAIPGIEEGKQMTTRLYEYLKVESFIQSFTTLAERSGFSIETIRNIFDEEVAKYEKMREEHPLEAPRVLGIDEKHLGRIMRGILVDIETGNLLDILPDNKAVTMQEGIKKLKDWDKNIKVVTTDMNNSYLSWLPTLLPGATVVIDKFHVSKDVNQRVSSTRKKLVPYRNSLIKRESDPKEKMKQSAALHIVQTNTRLFNFSMARIASEKDPTKAQKLATVIDTLPEFRLLHNLHYAVEYIYEAEDLEEAERRYQEWLTILPPADKRGYKDWCDAYDVDDECFEDWRTFSKKEFLFFKPYILNYFRPDCRFTNAAAEGLNRLIDNINTAGSGYEFNHLRAKCLYCSLIHEQINYGIDLKTVINWESSKPGTIGMMKPRTKTTYYGFTESIDHLALEPLNVYRKSKWFNDAFLDKLGTNETMCELDEDSLTGGNW